QLSAEHPGLESVEICLEITDRSPTLVEVILTPSSSRLGANGTAKEKKTINACGQSLEGGTSNRDAETLSRFTFGLTGTIKQTNGAIIKDATIELRSAGVKVQSVVSEESGNYRFEEVRPGDYKVHAEHSGYEPIDIPVTVGFSEPSRVWITLHESISVT